MKTTLYLSEIEILHPRKVQRIYLILLIGVLEKNDCSRGYIIAPPRLYHGGVAHLHHRDDYVSIGPETIRFIIDRPDLTWYFMPTRCGT